MKILLKLGGTLLDQDASLTGLARQIAPLTETHTVVVVHGGGKQVTRYLAERGVESRFVAGLRVSDAAVIEAATQVIAGAVNKKLVAAVIAAGRPAVGLSGVDSLTEAVQLNPDLDSVGRPVRTDGRLLDLLANAGYTPVVACLAGDRQGRIYNVNADSMAVSCALGWQAERLLFLTDVGGVRGSDGALLPELSFDLTQQLIRSGVAHGGMQAKLEAAASAVQGGVEVFIASGTEPGIALRLLRGEKLGTRWVR